MSFVTENNFVLNSDLLECTHFVISQKHLCVSVTGSNNQHQQWPTHNEQLPFLKLIHMSLCLIIVLFTCIYMFIGTQALVCYMSECIEVKEQPQISSPRRLSIFFEIRGFFGGGGRHFRICLCCMIVVCPVPQP